MYRDEIKQESIKKKKKGWKEEIKWTSRRVPPAAIDDMEFFFVTK